IWLRGSTSSLTAVRWRRTWRSCCGLLSRTYISTSSLEDVFVHSPPGYCQAVAFLRAAPFDGGEPFLRAQVQGVRVSPQRPYTEEFGIATHLTQALFSLKQTCGRLCRPGKSPSCPPSAACSPGDSQAGAIHQAPRLEGCYLELTGTNQE